jgi:activator of 2-hydroxyglutaryl-CoA dehydratase
MTGGVAKNITIVNILGRMMGREIVVPHDPQIVTALGAALLARN